MKTEKYLVCLWVKEEIGPVGICLHVSKLKEFTQTQSQNLLTDLTKSRYEHFEWLGLQKDLFKDYISLQTCGRLHLVLEFLGEIFGFIQRETRHQLRGEDVLAAQFVHNIWHVEIRMALQ